MVYTESEYAARQRTQLPLHRLCGLLRDLRAASGLSLAQFQDRFGISSVVLGSYERGDRLPPLPKLDAIFGFYGYRLDAVPIGATATRLPIDIVADLRAIADQLECQHHGLFPMHEPAPHED